VALVGLLPALSLLVGACLGLTGALDARVLAWTLPPTGGAAFLFWWSGASRLAMGALVCGFLASGAALAADARERALHSSVRSQLDEAFGGFLIESLGPEGRHDPVPSRVVLLEDAAPRDGFVALRARLVAISLHGVWHPADGGITVGVGGAAGADIVGKWRAGRTVEAPITFRRPVRYLNEGVPDLERDLALSGVALLGSVKSGLLINVVSRGGLVWELAADVRAHVRQAIGTWIERHDPVSAAVASAVLIGDRTALPAETREILQAAGTYHVIAISGGNIAILATAVALILLVLGIRGRLASAVAIIVLASYALVVTTGPSVWRATLMAVLYLAARTIDHRSGAWHAAAMSAALMIVVRPLDVRDPGFILTFGATVALLEGARFGATLMPRRRALRWLVASLSASMAVEVMLLPISAQLFSRVTAAGLVLNLCAVPLMGVVQIAALVVTLTSPVPGIAGSSGWIAHLAAQALVGSAHLVTIAPWSTARVPAPGALLVCLYYAALLTTLFCAGRVVRGTALLVMAVVAVLLTGPVDPSRLISSAEGTQTLRFTMLDVGQGESMLLEVPRGDRILVDTGGAPFGGGGVDIGARVLGPALWARGIRSLDAMLITHGDPDHLGGAMDVMANFAPRRLWMGVLVPTHLPTTQLLDTVARLRVPVDFRRAGESVTFGDARMRVLHPPEPDWERRRVRNDDSVVLEVVYRDVAILLTGDISAEIERAIVPRLTPARTRILKVAHHGSRTSSSPELLEAWRPQIAVISAGRGNTFGHPAPEVLRRLDAIGATVVRTDLDGQITVETDGRTVRVTTFVGRRP
jgi:competence protein ComEC